MLGPALLIWAAAVNVLPGMNSFMFLNIAMVRQFPGQYGDPTPEHLQMMRVVPDRFRNGELRGVVVPPPPHADDARMRSELHVLMRRVADPVLDPALCEEIDRDMVPFICRAAEAHGASADPGEIAALLDDLVPVLMRLKYHFNVPRPWQVAQSEGSSLWRYASPSANTPSYPSGHAAQAGAACGLLAARFPQAARGLDAASSAVGMSRLQLGVHFPADVLAGLRMGRQIGRTIAQ